MHLRRSSLWGFEASLDVFSSLCGTWTEIRSWYLWKKSVLLTVKVPSSVPRYLLRTGEQKEGASP